MISSRREDDWNAIDPNLVIDRDEQPWLVFGSYWSGIKLVRLDPESGKPPAGEAGPHRAGHAAGGHMRSRRHFS